MINLNKDLSVLTTIPEDSLNSLSEKSIWCICHSVEENTLRGETLTEVDLGIGSLLVSSEEDIIRYKFIPNNHLEESVKETLLNKKNPLELKLERGLVNKIVKTYKNIL